jgi:hypothetical protein
MFIDKQYVTELKKIIEYLIEESPDKRIMFLARMQGEVDEIICGTLTLERFWSLETNGKIFFNVCYLVGSA